MSALFKLNDELGFTSASKLYLAAKRRGLKVTKEEAKQVAERNVGNQTIGPLQPSKGKTVAESPNARWQMDLADVKADVGNQSEDKFFLNVVNVFNRKMYSEPLTSKTPEAVRGALKKIVARAPTQKPITISSDRGT